MTYGWIANCQLCLKTIVTHKDHNQTSLLVNLYAYMLPQQNNEFMVCRVCPKFSIASIIMVLFVSKVQRKNHTLESETIKLVHHEFLTCSNLKWCKNIWFLSETTKNTDNSWILTCLCLLGHIFILHAFRILKRNYVILSVSHLYMGTTFPSKRISIEL